MKLQLSTRLVSIIGIIILTLYLPPGGVNIIGSYGMDPGSPIDVIDLEIDSLIDLESSSSIDFFRTFSINKKHDVYLLHIDVQASENNVEDVFVEAKINNVTTNMHFEDSSTKYSSPNSFYGGTRLSFRINPVTTISVLSNTFYLSIDIVSSSLFGEAGTFHVKGAALESITPPTIDSYLENTSLPLEVSHGSWYIAPLSTLNERSIETRIFCNIIEDISLRLDISVSPLDYTLTSTNFKISNGTTTFESVSSGSNSLNSIVYVTLTKGDSLVLEFKFRPTSELANNVIQFELKVKATPVTIIPDNGPSGSEEETSDIDANFLNLALPDLELIRFSMIVIPLFFYFNRNKTKNKNHNLDTIEKGDSLGTNEK